MAVHRRKKRKPQNRNRRTPVSTNADITEKSPSVDTRAAAVDSEGYPLQPGQRVRLGFNSRGQGSITKVYWSGKQDCWCVQVEEFCYGTRDKRAHEVTVLRRQRRADDSPILDQIELDDRNLRLQFEPYTKPSKRRLRA